MKKLPRAKDGKQFGAGPPMIKPYIYRARSSACNLMVVSKGRPVPEPKQI
jgi:hypothetical protein